MKIDNSILQAGALVGVTIITAIAAWHQQWGIVSASVTGFFAILNIHPKDVQQNPSPPDPQSPPQGVPQ